MDRSKKYKLFVYIFIIQFILVSEIILFFPKFKIVNEISSHEADFYKCLLKFQEVTTLNITIAGDVEGKNINSSLELNKWNPVTYINNYTKPFIVELVKNATKDCIC